MIAGVSEEQLTHDRACKGDRGDILLSGAGGVLGLVESLEDGVDLADDTEKKSSIALGWFHVSRGIESAYPFK